uniref:7TM_GPCR_Srx domain-containing protein n=1 Tax=Rhabditophanes sp. KR3021 TaxID=114890 RepID=A0AC35U1R7_9BILA
MAQPLKSILKKTTYDFTNDSIVNIKPELEEKVAVAPTVKKSQRGYLAITIESEQYIYVIAMEKEINTGTGDSPLGTIAILNSESDFRSDSQTNGVETPNYEALEQFLEHARSEFFFSTGSRIDLIPDSKISGSESAQSDEHCSGFNYSMFFKGLKKKSVIRKRVKEMDIRDILDNPIAAGYHKDCHLAHMFYMMFTLLVNLIMTVYVINFADEKTPNQEFSESFANYFHRIKNFDLEITYFNYYFFMLVLSWLVSFYSVFGLIFMIATKSSYFSYVRDYAQLMILIYQIMVIFLITNTFMYWINDIIIDNLNPSYLLFLVFGVIKADKMFTKIQCEMVAH